MSRSRAWPTARWKRRRASRRRSWVVARAPPDRGGPAPAERGSWGLSLAFLRGGRGPGGGGPRSAAGPPPGARRRQRGRAGGGPGAGGRGGRAPGAARIRMDPRRFPLHLREGAEADDPALEAGDDLGVAADLVPARGPGPDRLPQHGLEGDGGEGEQLHHRQSRQSAAAEEEEERARAAAEAEGQRGVELMGYAEPGQQVGEEGRVGVGAGKENGHLFEGDAAGRLAQEAPRDRPSLGRLAGAGHELDGVVLRGRPGGGLEKARAKTRPARRRGQGGAPTRAASAIPAAPAAAGREGGGGRGGPSRRKRLTGKARASAERNSFSPSSSSRSSTIRISAPLSQSARPRPSWAAVRTVAGSATFPSRSAEKA